MVKLGQPNDCVHSTCHDSVTKDAAGGPFYGGFLCSCSCHDAKRAEDKAERDQREMCPFCHTNSDYQTSCCAKLACVYNRLVALKDHYAKLGLEYRVVEIEKILEGIVK